MNAKAAIRKGALAKIHIAKARLKLTDELYRSIVAEISGGRTSSAGELNEKELGQMLDRFKAAGFREGDSYSKKLDDFNDREPQARFIRCLWSDLGGDRGAP
jgi:hypothetical protein